MQIAKTGVRIGGRLVPNDVRYGVAWRQHSNRRAPLKLALSWLDWCELGSPNCCERRIGDPPRTNCHRPATARGLNFSRRSDIAACSHPNTGSRHWKSLRGIDIAASFGNPPARTSHDSAEFENAKSCRNRRHRLLYPAFGSILFQLRR